MFNKFFYSVVFLFCISCSNSIEDNIPIEPINIIENTIENYVSLSDIVTLNSVDVSNTRASSIISSSIECVTNDKRDTLIYVHKKETGGWTMYSSDTRLPAIIAHSESGSFEELMQIDAAKLWVQSMAEDIAMIKGLPDDKLNFTSEEIMCNKAFWKSISSPDTYVKEQLQGVTRAPDDSELKPILGHYEFRSSETYYEVYDSISALIGVDWDQYSPYNMYCPYKSNLSGRAPAGCVAIAVGQMLYFLNQKLGVPETAPSEAYCNGNVDSSDYDWAQTNYTSSIWNLMNVDGMYAAPLIADIGRRANMIYGDYISSAEAPNLPSSVFVPYGISCTHGNYNTETVKSSLLNGYPVMLFAESSNTSSNSNLEGGHAFITDRYRRHRLVTKNCYEWVYDSIPTDKPIPYVKPYVEYIYSSPSINMIGMNWGMGVYYNRDDEWFTLTGDWFTPNMDNHNWTIRRKMISSFQVLND